MVGLVCHGGSCGGSCEGDWWRLIVAVVRVALADAIMSICCCQRWQTGGLCCWFAMSVNVMMAMVVRGNGSSDDDDDDDFDNTSDDDDNDNFDQ